MKYFSFYLLLLIFSCSTKTEILKSEEIIAKSIQKHDPKNQWSTASFEVHIQEPRVKNPERFSIVKLNNENGSFELQRNRDASISKHSIDENGIAKTLLDDKISTDSLLIKKYRLDPERNFGYKRFYQLLLGLPMSLQDEKIALKDKVEEVIFNDKNAYKLSVELEKPMFSKNWNLYFSVDDFTLLGIEIIFPDDATKGERLLFDGEIKISNIISPRMRHWYELDNTYSGSDIILREVK
ncbi:DUF6503 family protein [Polaribacter porphyrae]|uniref:Uncharacterized protein n=1 Tax=Polaribacter porphyrae TaxID=1137780 RepID=A0A2S7WS64_9FLAO|nr:DUF6503 family protein [Polaribacter porphyrae]PQJ80437.1 hypothetical protein BTO18_15215 [Polaribacter porphyrae]